MKKTYKSLLSCLCLTAILTAGSMISAGAATTDGPSGTIKIHGPITKTENGKLVLDSQGANAYNGEMILNLSEETKILDAVNGFPLSFDQLKEGESAYAYIGQTMTMSLPPMTNATLILANIPADYKVPEFLESDSLSIHADGVSGTVKSTSGTTYTIPADCTILPYLTRNIATIQDLSKGRTFLLWSDSENKASKIVVFPKGTNEHVENSLLPRGWSQEHGNWVYYNAEGNLHKGWLLDQGDWFYLNPETGIMETGFLTLEGKTYYLQDDGRMLTKSKTFTPDEHGVLHEYLNHV